jgi:hypothetical protein
LKLPLVRTNELVASFTVMVADLGERHLDLDLLVAAGGFVTSVAATVSSVSVTAVTMKVPLLAALSKPLTVILWPTLKPSPSLPHLPSVLTNLLPPSIASVPSFQPISTIAVGSCANGRISAS